MFEPRPPAENPAGGGPENTNALLDALRNGDVLKKTSDIVEVYFQMDGGGSGRIRRVSFAGSPPAIRKARPMDPLSFAASVSKSMAAGLSEFSLTTPQELEQREQHHRVARAFWMWWRMEREVDRDD